MYLYTSHDIRRGQYLALFTFCYTSIIGILMNTIKTENPNYRKLQNVDINFGDATFLIGAN